MPIAFIDRNPTDFEVEKIRLILSTYQDGTGMNAYSRIKTEQKNGSVKLSSLFSFADVINPKDFVLALRDGDDTISTYLKSKLTKKSLLKLRGYSETESVPLEVKQVVVALLRREIKKTDFYIAERFAGVELSEATKLLLSEELHGENLLEANRSLLEDAYPTHLIRNRTTLPGWRDFERAVALALGGRATEGKFVYDVVFGAAGTKYGLSCKMRGELNRVLNNDGRVTIEVSNAAGEFWDYLATRGITAENYTNNPTGVGKGVVELVTSWHVHAEANGGFDTKKCWYLVLQYNDDGWYQMFKYPMDLINLDTLKWSIPSKKGSGTVPSRRVVGKLIDDRFKNEPTVEWYGKSGAQLKYYPLASQSFWTSKPFRLEPPNTSDSGIRAKVAAEFPQQWKDAVDNKPNGSKLSYTNQTEG